MHLQYRRERAWAYGLIKPRQQGLSVLALVFNIVRAEIHGFAVLLKQS